MREMQPVAGVGAQSAPPGVFETIAIAMSALLARPLPLAFPLAVDLYLWGGARLSPAGLLAPLGGWFARQDGAEAAGLADWLERLARTADLAAIVGWFVPSLLAGTNRADLFAAWPRPSVDLGGAALTVAVAGLLVLVGVVAAMTLAVMLARVVRDRSLLGDRFARASGIAALRYLSFLALTALALVVLVVPAAIVGAVFLLAGVNIMPLLGAALTIPAVAAAVALAFVGEAIVLAEVGPLRAIALSFGVVRRNPWPTVGLLIVLLIVSVTVPQMVGRLTETALGLAVAVAAYAFVATGLALARMQFFYDRLRHWRADLIPTPVASRQSPDANI